MFPVDTGYEVLLCPKKEVRERKDCHESEEQVLETCGSLEHMAKRSGCMVAARPLIFSRMFVKPYFFGLFAMIWSLILS